MCGLFLYSTLQSHFMIFVSCLGKLFNYLTFSQHLSSIAAIGISLIPSLFLFQM